MATQTTKGSGNEKRNFTTVLGGGNIANTTTITNNSLVQNAYKSYNWGTPVPNPLSALQPVQLGQAVAITAITQSSSTGYVNIQKSSHGLVVGDIVKVYGTNVSGYNVIHVVTVVTDSSNVQTSVKYSADTSVHGNYKKLAGIFNGMTANCYVGMVIGKDTSGNAITSLKLAGSSATRRAIPMARGNQRYNITAWNYVTGAATKGANAGDTVTYIDTNGGAAVTQETIPTRAIPGELTYSIGTKVPTMADYKQRNG